MLRKILRIVISCSALFILASCKTDILVDIYSSDLFLDENVDTPAQMKVEIPSCSQRSKYEEKVLALFNTSSMAKIIGCEVEGMESMLVVSITAEIASETSSRDLALFRQTANDIEFDGGSQEVRGVKLFINQQFLQRVKTFMQENMQTLSYEDVRIAISVNNDERTDILVTGYNLWVDGQPHEFYRRQSLARRQKLELLFSNVTSDLVLRGKMPVAFWVGRQK